MLLSSVGVRARSSLPDNYYSYIDNSIDDENDAGSASATPLATKLVAPPPSPQTQGNKSPSSLPEYRNMNQHQSEVSDNFGWGTELVQQEDTQTLNTRYYPQHSNNQEPVSNSITNMKMDPSYSYGYSMHDKVNITKILQM